MYLLDANAFIEANRLYYAFDIVPGFWTWLGGSSLESQVASVEAIKDELTAGSGDLVDWARARPDAFWLPDTVDVVAAMAQLSAWATDPARDYRREAVDEFLDSADLKLIAHAMATEATVVTREQPAPDAKKKIKIPDACIASASAGKIRSAHIGRWGFDSSPESAERLSERYPVPTDGALNGPNSNLRFLVRFTSTTARRRRSISVGARR